MARARVRDAEGRQARAERILDAAGELLQRWGYKRVTIDDVAREAGIGKGTVYLHWRTREDLFEAVLQREMLGLADDLIAAIRDDPELVLLHRMGRFAFAGVIGRPLLRAVYFSDAEVLGSLAKHADVGLEQRQDEVFKEHLAMLMEHGLVADGFDVDGLMYAFQAIAMGFFVSDTMFGPHNRVPHDRMLDLLELTLRRTLGPAEAPPPEAVRAIQAQTVAAMQRIVDDTRRHLSRAYEQKSPQ